MITFVDSERDTIEIIHESKDDTIRFRGTPFITRNNAAQIWPVFKRFAETGELVENPDAIDDSESCAVPCACGRAKCNGCFTSERAWSDRIADNIVQIHTRLEMLARAIDSIGLGMTALDERLKAVEVKPLKPDTLRNALNAYFEILRNG